MVAFERPLSLPLFQIEDCTRSNIVEGGNMKHGPVRVVFGLVMLIASAVVAAEESHHWETATVISQTIGSSPMGECSGQVGNGAVAAPTNRKTNTVVVDTGRYRYSLQELTGGSDGHPLIVLTGHDHIAHEQMKFYRDGPSFVVLDNQGETHKFCLLHAMKFE
jgi:hypothetical protein